MKKYLVLMLAVLGVAFSSQAQEKKNKNAKVDVEVKGNCDMCKKRIEKAALGVKGVKSANWHSDDQTLHLLLDENKTDGLKVSEAVAKAGHDTKEVKATKDAYDGLHGCCQYDRES
ncbi:metal transporter [Flavobacterium sp. xlx-214]|uniref:heavy-metal-associated domain-containing protein n=1 Tax=unclassified Flavobacterium TaxID=196869 RepID=UPI0013D125BD|nr:MULTISPECIES: metal transporter [unclassified Flavobacterium]MBA5793354.1 metal transporter [Flavobacterium sp. xlx-221]QMI84084.1 metal transporter [Flavobacterium sp. xlx-214]